MGSLRSFPTLILLCACTRDIEPRLEKSLGNWDEFDNLLKLEKDVIKRDLILLKFAVQRPEMSQQLCRKVQSSGAIEKCKQVIGRPHLSGQ